MFYLLGINTLIPWSFFITADDVSYEYILLLCIADNMGVYLSPLFLQYWMYKFREVHENSTRNYSLNHAENLEKRTDLQASFTSYLSVASALPNTFFLIINAFISKR